MEVNSLTWGITIVVLLGFIIFDFVSHVRKPHEPTIKEAAGWMIFLCSSGLRFWYFLVVCLGRSAGQT